MKYALATISYLITAFALIFLTVRVRQLIAIYKKQQPDPTRSNNKSARFKNMLTEVLGHTKMLNFTATGIAHWFVMIGFGALFGTLVTAYGQVINPDFALPIIGHFVGYELFAELIAALTGIGIVTLIGIRQVTRLRKRNRFSGSNMGKAYYIEATILSIVFCVIALRGLEGALANEESWNWHYAISWPAVLAFNSMSVASLERAIVIVATLKIVISMAWFIVIASDFTMGIAWHRFLAFFNIYYKRNIDQPALGALPEMLSKGKPVNFEDPAEDDVFGLGTRGDISWKGLLDMTSCTECGRCQSQCPAWHTDKPLSPKLLIMAMRDHAMSKVVETENIVGENAPISLDVLWSCTSCGACVEECPVDIEHVDHIVNMRRFQVLVESEFPTELGGTFRNLEKAGNPWGANKADRESWIAECDFPVRVVSGELPEEVEYLFWVGCAGAYEDRAKKTTKAVAELLHMAGVNFAVLGKRETCTGDPARRSGNEFLYQILSQENIATFNETFGDRSKGKKKVVVTCPHCFTTIGRDYAQSGFELEMLHHTQLLNTLIKEGRLKPSPHKSDKKLTYHDPCYLGRHNQIYAPPRELLEASGCDVEEMPRNKERSFCCGGGGGRMWMEEKLGTRINLNRVDEAIDTGAQEVAVACPFCRIMVGDGMVARQSDVEVLDVAQILLRSVKASE
ncbi:(Fe-S)-binding protein [Candidatus Planktophila versatilis]|uniref:(Fe-S)-binding protein n=1 Tax=Candidatus Planktophila versatilis TaxID=1884905 RepID=UPI000BAC6D6B|nr:(Fe-S)-binding protein [Candidatus Planktophila versatilis]ASY26957.1 enoyl-CoA hydratase [Candidatus Planktophila versatilis]